MLSGAASIGHRGLMMINTHGDFRGNICRDCLDKGERRCFKNLKIGARLMALLGFVLLVLIAISIMAQQGLGDGSEDLQITYEQKLQPIRLSARIQRLIEETRSQLMLGLQHNPKSELAKLHDHPLSMHTDIIAKSLADAEACLEGTDPRPHAAAQTRRPCSRISRRPCAAYIAEGLDPALKALQGRELRSRPTSIC